MKNAEVKAQLLAHIDKLSPQEQEALLRKLESGQLCLRRGVPIKQLWQHCGWLTHEEAIEWMKVINDPVY